MIFRLLISFGLMGAAAFTVARSTASATPVVAWLVIAAAICALSAGALASQPLGVPTRVGAVGSLFLQWGFKAGHGRLFPAVAISWIVWAVFGTAVIFASMHNADRELQIMIIAWAADSLGLMYIVGLMIERMSASMTRGLFPTAAVLTGMIVVSALQWKQMWLPGGRQTALLIGAGPPLVVGAGYAVFLIGALTFGRFARWN